MREVLKNKYVAVSGAVIYGALLALLLAFWFTPWRDAVAPLVASPVLPTLAMAWAVIVVVLRRRMAGPEA